MGKVRPPTLMATRMDVYPRVKYCGVVWQLVWRGLWSRTVEWIRLDTYKGNTAAFKSKSISFERWVKLERTYYGNKDVTARQDLEQAIKAVKFTLDHPVILVDPFRRRTNDYKQVIVEVGKMMEPKEVK